MSQPNWVTPIGVVNQSVYSLGNFPSGIEISQQLQADPVNPATSVTYKIISGFLPAGLLFNNDTGLIYGTPSTVNEEVVSTFTIRATDNFENIKDRTFKMAVTGTAIPSFITPAGSLFDTEDSVWISFNVLYDNPDISNIVKIRLLEGSLPPGLEINSDGLIRGYPEPPTINVTLPSITTAATLTETTNNITCLSTTGFIVGRPVRFSGTVVFGGITAGVTYYIKTIVSSTSFTISTTPNGPTLSLTSDTGFMTVTVEAISVGQPTKRTYNFTLKLDSLLGGDSENYSITIRNQNLSTSEGGPGLPLNSRIPTILNTQPETFYLNNNNEYFGYYVLPPNDSNFNTYPPTYPAFMGQYESNNYFAFKVIGKDFDNNVINYAFSNLPLGLTGNSSTGWIVGTPTLNLDGINQFGFNVHVYKVSNPVIKSETFNFSFNVAKNIEGNIIWSTSENLGIIFNGTLSTKNVSATSDVELLYRIVSGQLPPNLTLLDNGEITGYVSNQPTDELLSVNEETNFNFVVEAYSSVYPAIKSQKQFTLTVLQKYSQPTDTLYIKASPSLADRELIKSLLQGTLSETIFPNDYLYRPNDIYFGKATDIIYEHAYGIFSSDIDEYLAAVQKNHYWRNITLGEIKTAIAKNSQGEIIYEVVYSEVIDNLVNPQNISVSSEIYWPRPINLFLGPWYTSITNIYTSYASVLGQDYYTSLSSGSVRQLYPNSLFNMRNRVAEIIGQEFDSSLLPLWMTSQQENGSTLGYTQAWVICYTKPGYAQTIKNNINTLWLDPMGDTYKLNQINFKIDRFSVNKQITYNFDKNASPPAWTNLPSATPVPNPLDSKNFYVLFPRQTILPDSNQI